MRFNNVLFVEMDYDDLLGWWVRRGSLSNAGVAFEFMGCAVILGRFPAVNFGSSWAVIGFLGYVLDCVFPDEVADC